MNPDKLRLVLCQTQVGGLIQLTKTLQHPRTVRLKLWRGGRLSHRLPKRRGGALSNVIRKVVSSGHSTGQQWAGQLGNRLGKLGFGEVDWLSQPLALRAVVHQAPNATGLTIATGVVEPYLIVANNAVIKIGDVQCTVGTELQINRPEPRVSGSHEVRQFDTFWAAAKPINPVTIDAAGHDIADENIVAEFRRPMIRLVKHNATQAGGVVVVLDDQWGKAHAVVGLAEARVVGIANQLVDRRAMTVGGVEVTKHI